jgi:hypothetical protein
MQLTEARSRRDAFITRGPQRVVVYVRPPEGVAWQPTPTREENDRIALDPSAITFLKFGIARRSNNSRSIPQPATRRIAAECRLAVVQ